MDTVTAETLTTAESPEQKLPKASVFLKEAKVLYRKHWKVFTSIIAVMAVPYTIVTLVLGRHYLAAHSPLASVIQLVFMVILIWAYAALYKSVISASEGHPVTFEGAYAEGTKRAGIFFLTSLLVGLAVMGGLILLIIPGFIFMVWYGKSTWVAINENLGAVASMKKSKAYVKGNFWPVVGRAASMLGLTLLVYIAMTIVSVILVIAFRGNTVAAQLVSPLIMIFWAPFIIIYQFFVYRALKRMHEAKVAA